MTIFLSPVNTLMAHAFLSNIKLKYQQPLVIMGFKSAEDEGEVPDNVSKVLDDNISISDLNAVIFSCDFIVLELLKMKDEVLEDVLSVFSDNYFENQKKLLLISHPFLWYQTPNLSNLNPADSEVFTKIKNHGVSQHYNNVRPVILDIDDFTSRRTLPCYEIKRLFENQFQMVCSQNHSI